MQTTGSRVLPKTRYRIVVMGAAEVGKTCIITRLLYHKFLTEYKATVEELHSGQFEVNGLPLTLDILDTSGLYQFPAMRRLSITTGDAFVLVYSVNDPASFGEVERLREEILLEKTKDALPLPVQRKGVVPLVVVGNKTDLNCHEVTSLVYIIIIIVQAVASIPPKNKSKIWRLLPPQKCYNMKLLFLNCMY